MLGVQLVVPRDGMGRLEEGGIALTGTPPGTGQELVEPPVHHLEPWSRADV